MGVIVQELLKSNKVLEQNHRLKTQLKNLQARQACLLPNPECDLLI